MTRTQRLALILTLLCAGNSSAAILTYTDRTVFLSALTSFYDNDLQSLSAGALGSPQSFSGNGFSYQVASSGGLYVVDISGDRSLATNLNFTPLVIQNLTGGVTAIGGYFFFNQAGAIQSSTTGSVTAVNGVDPDSTLTVTAPTSLTGFYGFISTGGNLTSLTFANTGGSGFPNVDDLIVGNSQQQGGGGGGGGGGNVPEPGTFALVAMVLCSVGLIRRRA